MRTFFKAKATSLMSSGIDFLITTLCVQLWHYWYLSASVTGAVVGGPVNFIVSKKWTFAECLEPVASQFSRFVLVWLGNAGANATGLFVTPHFLGVQYLLAKIAVGILIGVSYTFFLQKDFVFTRS